MSRSLYYFWELALDLIIYPIFLGFYKCNAFSEGLNPQSFLNRPMHDASFHFPPPSTLPVVLIACNHYLSSSSSSAIIKYLFHFISYLVSAVILFSLTFLLFSSPFPLVIH